MTIIKFKKDEIPCELCSEYKAIRRKDNLYVCDKCNEKYPTKDV